MQWLPDDMSEDPIMIFEKLKKLRRKDQIQDGGSTTWLKRKVNSRKCVGLSGDTISEDFRKLYQLWKIGNSAMKSNMAAKPRDLNWKWIAGNV